MSERPNPPRALVVAAFAAVYITWGSTFLAIAYAVRTIPVFLMGGVRFLIAGTVLVMAALLAGARWPSGQQLRAAATAGFLLLAIGNTGVVWAETRVPSGTTSLLVTTPFWVTLYEWSRGRRPHRGVIVGLVLGIGGLALLVAPHDIAGAAGVDPLAAAVLIGCSCCWAAGSLYTRYASLPDSPLLGTGLQMLSGGIVLVLAAWGTGEVTHFTLRQVSGVSWLGFAYLIVGGSLIGFSAYVWLFRNVAPALAATFAFVNPIIAVLLGWAVAGEPLSARTIVAGCAIVAAVCSTTLAPAEASPARERNTVDAD
jgi:drug/metabolite transporter (DMT)-like permease